MYGAYVLISIFVLYVRILDVLPLEFDADSDSFSVVTDTVAVINRAILFTINSHNRAAAVSTDSTSFSYCSPSPSSPFKSISLMSSSLTLSSFSLFLFFFFNSFFSFFPIFSSTLLIS